MKFDLLLLNATVFILMLTFYFSVNFGNLREEYDEEHNELDESTTSHHNEAPDLDHHSNSPLLANTIPVLGPGYDILGADPGLANDVKHAREPRGYTQILPGRHISFEFDELPGVTDMGTKLQLALEIGCMLRAQVYFKGPQLALNPGHNGGPVTERTWDELLTYRVIDPRKNLCEACGIPKPINYTALETATKIDTKEQLLGRVQSLKPTSRFRYHVRFRSEELTSTVVLLSTMFLRCKSLRIYPKFAMDARRVFQKEHPKYLALKIRMGDDSRKNKPCSEPIRFKSYFEEIDLKANSTVFIMGNFDNQFKRDFIRTHGATHKLVFEQDVKSITKHKGNFKMYIAAYAIAEGASQGLIQIQRKTKFDNDGRLPSCKAVYYAPRETPGDIWWGIFSKAAKVFKIS